MRGMILAVTLSLIAPAMLVGCLQPLPPPAECVARTPMTDVQLAAMNECIRSAVPQSDSTGIDRVIATCAAYAQQ